MRKTDEKETENDNKTVRDPQTDLLKAQIRFAKAVNSLNPLNIVEKRPFFSTGCAFGLGFLFTSFLKRPKLSSLPILPIVFQIGDMAMRYLLERKN